MSNCSENGILGFSNEEIETIGTLRAKIAELEVDLETHKADRVLLQQEIRSLRRLDPAE